MAAAEIAERLMSMGFPLSGLDEWNTGDLIDWIAAYNRRMRIRNGENVPDPYEQYLTLKAMEPDIEEMHKAGQIRQAKYESYRRTLDECERRLKE